MASQADVRRIALSLPATGEAPDFLLALDPVKFFTEPHYNGFPAVLVRLPAVTARELRPLIAEAWRCPAPKDLDADAHVVRRTAGVRSGRVARTGEVQL